MNKVFLIGNLTHDVELTETESGIKKVKIGIAVNRNYPNADGDYECDFFTAIVWRKQAEALAKYCSKGDKIAICGELQNYNYEAVNGDKKQIAIINVSELDIIKSAKLQNKIEEAKKAKNKIEEAKKAKKAKNKIEEAKKAQFPQETMPF